MKNAWIIYRQEDAEKNAAYIDWFYDESKYLDIDLHLVYIEDIQIGIAKQNNALYLKNQRAKIPDFIIMRAIDFELHQQLEHFNCPVFNSSHISLLANHKALTYQAIQALDIPVQDSFFLRQDNLPSSPPLAFPFVMKDAKGRGGQSVFWIEDQKMWYEKTEQASQDMVIQSVEEIVKGYDLRVFILGKEIVAAVLRVNPDDFRANYKLGGHAKLYHLNQSEKTMIQKIIDQYNFDFVGIDFLINIDNQLIFNEIEDVVGSRILSETTNINIVQKYLKYILQKMG